MTSGKNEEEAACEEGEQTKEKCLLCGCVCVCEWLRVSVWKLENISGVATQGSNAKWAASLEGGGAACLVLCT